MSECVSVYMCVCRKIAKLREACSVRQLLWLSRWQLCPCMVLRALFPRQWALKSTEPYFRVLSVADALGPDVQRTESSRRPTRPLSYGPYRLLSAGSGCAFGAAGFARAPVRAPLD